jgi:3-oxoacyl-[acyl-carrier-protein] synthase-1/3-oxoacyl-[acyl-carrier-protein] synthase II
MNGVGPVSPVAVTGVGCLSAAGFGLDASLDSLFRGERNVGPPKRFTTDHPGEHPVFEVERDYFPGAATDDERPYLRTTSLAVSAAELALADGGYSALDLEGLRVGVIVGTTVGAALNNETFYREYLKGNVTGTGPCEPLLRMGRSNPAAEVSRRFGFTGPTQTVVNACSSGTDAIGLGAAWIRGGLADVVLAGGADELCRFTYCGFISLMVASRSPCKPFDQNRTGLNLGEGAAFLILESDELSAKRAGKAGKAGRAGGTARAAVYGFGSACDAHHLTAPHPEGAGLKRAVRRALATWGGDPEELALVNAHGTSTRDNDLVEGRALAELLPAVPFHSTKGYTGHTLGAAGAIEAAFVIGFLERGRAPASAGFDESDPAIGAAPFSEEIELRGRFGLSQSLAFGGSNSALVLGIEK